ncbi:MAG: hypothetical protein AAF289_01510 [Cyanobacteria bacterium P01_A01_bin.135]
MSQVLYPNVDLFLYDLHDGLGVSRGQLGQSRRRFWQRIYGNGRLTDAKLAELQSTEKSFSGYVELLGSERFEDFSDDLEGYYYPVKLGDTYALQVNCAGKKDTAWEALPLVTKLRQTKKIVLEHTQNIPGGIGQNWLVWAQLTEPHQDPVEVAKDCCTALDVIPSANWQFDLKGKGSHQEAMLFEFERRDEILDGSNDNRYVLVCLFPHYFSQDEIAEFLNQFYRDLIYLFYYRNKILWAYEQSCQIKDKLKDCSGVIQKIIKSLPTYVAASSLDLKQLQIDLSTALQVSHLYETSLGYLQDHLFTIKINTGNYSDRILELAKLDTDKDAERAREKLSDPDSLGFLKRFGDFAERNCLGQIQVDYEALSAGLKPLDNFIRAVEGITEIEKAKNERTFNRTVAAASVGISAASLFASSYTGQAAEIVQTVLPVPANTPPPAINTLLTFGSAFVGSLLFGICGAVATWYLSNRIKRS